MNPPCSHGPGVVEQGHDAFQRGEVSTGEVEVGEDHRGIGHRQTRDEGSVQDGPLHDFGAGCRHQADPGQRRQAIGDLECGFRTHPFFSPTNQSSLRSKSTLNVVSEP